MWFRVVTNLAYLWQPPAPLEEAAANVPARGPVVSTLSLFKAADSEQVVAS